jgi:hypothetical protein
VEKALAKGIAIDPGVAEQMKAAPEGSCFNDPTQAQCPPVKRMARTVTTPLADGWLAYGPAPAAADATATIARRSPARARAAAIDQCAVRADYPYYSVGRARGGGANQCSSAVSRQELYVSLYDYISTGRRLLDTKSASGGGGVTIRAYPSSDCAHSATARKYEVLAEGYSYLRGVWYAANQTKYDTFRCPE